MARNLDTGRGLSTSLIHFDTERSSGRMPAPLTTFPPLYPEVLAVAAPLFSSAETAATFIAGLCFLADMGMLTFLAATVGLSVWATRLLLILYLLSATQLRFGNAVMAEPLFQSVSLAALLLLFVALREHGFRKRTLLLLAAGALVGLSYWIRYAGLFVFVSVWLFMALRWLLVRTRANAVDLASCLVSTALVAALMARNVVISGTWKGGNGKLVHNSPKLVISQMFRSELHAVLGSGRVGAGFYEVLLLAGLLGLGVMWVLARPKKLISSSALILSMIYLLVYSAGLIYLGLFSVIDLSERMVYPLLPIYLLLLVLLIDRLWQAAAARGERHRYLMAAAVFLMVGGYAGINLRDWRTPQQPSDETIREAVGTSFGQVPAIEWANSHLCHGEPVAATAGQTTGYLLHRDTLSLVPAQYSSTVWNADTVMSAMRRYRIRYLFLYRSLPEARGLPETDQPPEAESSFIRQAETAPDVPGFRVAAENQRLRVLVLEDQMNRKCL